MERVSMKYKYHGFTIEQNEFGWFNVRAINCWSAQSAARAEEAIDLYRERCNLDENGVPCPSLPSNS